MKKASAITLKSIIVLILTICLLCSCSLFDSNDKSDPHNTSAVEQTSENHSLSEDAENQKKELTKAFQELTFEDTTTVESDLQNAYKISELLNNLEARFLNGADFFSLDQAMHCNQLCFEALKTLEESDKVEYVSSNPFDTFVRFKSGLNYLYQPKTEQLLNRNDNEAFQLIAIEPYHEEFKVIPFSFEEQYKESYQPLLEPGFADLTKPLLNQPKLFQDDQFSLDVLKSLPKYSVIQWIGHGTSVRLKKSEKEETPVLMTNIKVSSVENFDNFKSLYQKEKKDNIWNLFGLTNNDTVFITPEFLRLTIPENSLKGSIVHLGTCRSAWNNELLQVFIDKGAAFVTGYTDYVQPHYEKEIKRILTEQMMEKKQDGSFMLLKDALEEARILVAKEIQNYSYEDEMEVSWENGFDKFIRIRADGYQSKSQLVYLENPDFPNYSLGNLIEKKQKHILFDAFKTKLQETDFDYGESSRENPSYQYALINMNEDDIPELLIKRSGSDYSLDDIIAFIYDQTSGSLNQSTLLVQEGVAPAGGYRGSCAHSDAEPGLFHTYFLSGTGEGAIQQFTIESGLLEVEEKTLYEGPILGDESSEAGAVEKQYDLKEIEWSSIDDLKNLEVLKDLKVAERNNSSDKSDLAELIKTEENNGQIVLSGTIRILSGDELWTLQGVDPLYQDNDQHTIFVLDEVKNMDVVSMGGIKNCDVSMIEIKDLSQSQDYDGKEAVISFDPSELKYPSDASLPLGEPRTTVYKILSAK